MTPADTYFGRKHTVVSEREKIKKRTLRKRTKEYLAAMAAGRTAKTVSWRKPSTVRNRLTTYTSFSCSIMPVGISKEPRWSLADI